jgi:hypothetical protein
VHALQRRIWIAGTDAAKETTPARAAGERWGCRCTAVVDATGEVWRELGLVKQADLVR